MKIQQSDNSNSGLVLGRARPRSCRNGSQTNRALQRLRAAFSTRNELSNNFLAHAFATPTIENIIRGLVSLKKAVPWLLAEQFTRLFGLADKGIER
ncbi:MAG: hypothetical protein WBX38_21845 [Candidatus Sulfotelmatobacter sp.]